MSTKNRVVWSQGMFLRPQHFQQLDNSSQATVANAIGGLNICPKGFEEITIDRDALSLGKLAIRSAKGLFADRTGFSVPDDDQPPLALDVPEDLKDKIVYLCLPAARDGVLDYTEKRDEESLARYVRAEIEVGDRTASDAERASIEVGKLNLVLLDETAHLDPYLTLAVAKIIEVRPDGHVMIDESFVQPVLKCEASQPMSDIINELLGLLRHRGESLAGRVSASGRGGASDIQDFLLLQLVNRYLPLMDHLSKLPALHPEDLYRLTVSLAGELATFTTASKFTETFPVYDHDDLQATYQPVMKSLRHSLSMVLEQQATSLPLKKRKYGISVATVPDRTLYESATFVIAVNASIPQEELRKRFPLQVKLGSVEVIRKLVTVQLPGIQIRPLPVAPRQIPFLSGYSYFELEKSGEYWEQLSNSGGLAIHVGGEFPDLEMDFWAVRQ